MSEHYSTTQTVKRMAKRLQRVREQRGLTQTELARKAGLTREYVCILEAAKQDPSISVMAKLAKALKVPMAELVE